MPSAANAKSEKPASSEDKDTPIRQIMTIIEHKIRNLEKRKSKLTSYRDLQKAGKELNSDQKVAVAKYDEVAQTLEFARDLSKQVTAIAISSEREAKKQAKKEAWVRYAAETNKIKEVLLILDCLMQMGSADARTDFINGTNGAAKLTEDDLKILDDLYPEVTPKHELNEEGQSGFHLQITRAAEHLYSIIDGKPKEVLGTTYLRIKEIVSTVHECGYFDKTVDGAIAEVEESHVPVEEEVHEQGEHEPEVDMPVGPAFPPTGPLPVPPAPAVVPAPGYPLRPLPPITLQEVEHAYFAQQYPQQRPITEVIGSQNFFFLQESEIDSPVGTPQPPAIPNQVSPPGPIPTQTFTNQHYVQLPGGRVPEPGSMPMPPQPHFPPHPEHAGFVPAPVPMPPVPTHPHGPLPANLPPPLPPVTHAAPPPQPVHHTIQPAPALVATLVHASVTPVLQEDTSPVSPLTDKEDDCRKDGPSPELENGGDRKGDSQSRYRRFGRGGRGAPNGHRGRGAFPNRQGGDGYRGRQGGDYQNRSNREGFQNRQYDGYQNRHANRTGGDGYYGNGDVSEGAHHAENGRERYGEGNGFQGGYKGRGRGAPRGATRGASRPPRAQHYTRRSDNAE
ncbi:caprin homolog isoform X2 [Bombyx mandarina]|uniref:Caprin homolog isoform X1 n=1 Tax=Bombyx mandarina TaxID=7092 RepID=A0A6J2KA52_BOMMA|nr:caprin homolog isoform X1 [Bombyx mandarina]XP_028039161.1 caprin homolog isoform X2 [Bombyx mandarina]